MYIENANRFMGMWGTRGGGGGGGGQKLVQTLITTWEWSRSEKVSDLVSFFREGEGGGSKGEA